MRHGKAGDNDRLPPEAGTVAVASAGRRASHSRCMSLGQSRRSCGVQRKRQVQRVAAALFHTEGQRKTNRLDIHRAAAPRRQYRSAVQMGAAIRQVGNLRAETPTTDR